MQLRGSSRLQKQLAFVCCVLGASSEAVANLRYQLEELPIPSNVPFTVHQVYAGKVNELGQVFATVTGSKFDGQHVVRPYLFQSGQWTGLPVPESVRESYSNVFNNSGNASTTEFATSDPSAPSECRLFEHGDSIEVLPETFLVPLAVADDGWYAGQYLTDRTAQAKLRSVIYKDGVRIDIGTLGGDRTEARGMNNNHQIVGFSAAATGGYGFIWENGLMRKLTHPELLRISPSAISDNGWIAGGADGKDGNTTMITMRGAEVYQHEYQPDYAQIISAIDLQGTAVGHRAKVGASGLLQEALIYDHGQRDVIWSISDADTKGWSTLNNATDINDFGVICGWGTKKNGQIRGWIARPVPEPASWLALGIGALAVGLRRSRKYQG